MTLLHLCSARRNWTRRMESSFLWEIHTGSTTTAVVRRPSRFIQSESLRGLFDLNIFFGHHHHHCYGLRLFPIIIARKKLFLHNDSHDVIMRVWRGMQKSLINSRTRKILTRRHHTFLSFFVSGQNVISSVSRRVNGPAIDTIDLSNL